jgi:hypothetical protein
VVSEPLVDVELVFSPGLEYRVQGYADGFELRGWVDGESGQFRHWPLGVGWVQTTGDNEVRDVTSHACVAGVVEMPVSERIESASVSARMRWPEPVSARMQRDGAVTRYEMAFASEPPVRWLRLASAAAWVGLSAQGELSRVACTAAVPERERVPLRLPSDRFAVSLLGSWLLQVELEPEGWGDGGGRSAGRSGHHESARGNAWLSVGHDGVFEQLDVRKVEEGDAVAFDPKAPEADGVEGWQDWPVDVRATVWRAGEQALVGVRFGSGEAEEWRRLGADVLVGSTASQEIVALVLEDVEQSPGGAGPEDFDDDLDTEPGELPGHGRLVEQAESLRFVVYGLAGELGAPGGFSSGRGGVGSSLKVTFGDEEGDRWLTVTSSREADLDLARLRMASDLVPRGEGPYGDSTEALEAFLAQQQERHRQVRREVLSASWGQVTIPVDGTGVEFGTIRHGDRWTALSRVGHTTITIVAQGREPDEVELVTITDLAPHVDYARRQHRERIERHSAEQGLPWPTPQPRISHADRARRSAVRAVVAGLMDGLHRNAGAPELGEPFTPRVVDAWGGRDRYQQLLSLHTMLRPISGHGTSSDYPKFNDDGTAEMRVSINHAAPDGESGRSSFTLTGSATIGGDDEPQPEPEPEPEPDVTAIRRGEQHHITFHHVEDRHRPTRHPHRTTRNHRRGRPTTLPQEHLTARTSSVEYAKRSVDVCRGRPDAQTPHANTRCHHVAWGATADSATAREGFVSRSLMPSWR